MSTLYRSNDYHQPSDLVDLFGERGGARTHDATSAESCQADRGHLRKFPGLEFEQVQRGPVITYVIDSLQVLVSLDVATIPE